MSVKKSGESKQTSGMPLTSPTEGNVKLHGTSTPVIPDIKAPQIPIESSAVGAFKGLWRACRWPFRGVRWMILNTFAPYISIENRTVDDLELMSEKNKRTLLKNASTEALQWLVDRDPKGKQVFLALFAALGPKDASLVIKYFNAFPDFQELQALKPAFLLRMSKNLGVLSESDVDQLSKEDRRPLIMNASTKALQRLIARDKQVFRMLFSALGPKDVATKAKCFKCFGNIPEFQDLSDKFLSETNEYLLNLETAGLEALSPNNRRALLECASAEALQRLMEEKPQVFRILFSALGLKDVALRAKCFKCFGSISEFQDLRNKFLSETNEYLLNLKTAGLKALSPDDRRALLEYASTEALQRLIGRDRQVFLKLFTVIRVGDAEIIEKCSPFLSKNEALLPSLQASIQKAIELDPSEVSEFLRSRRVGQAIAISMASFCFDELGKINPERVAVLKLALEDKGSFFYQPPCSTVPGIKLTRIQAARVLGNGELFSVLNDASDLESNDYGRQVLSLMSPGGQPPLKLNMAVLASLLSPHRQTGLPTCTIHSIINADIHNNPAIPARMMIQGLTTGVTNTPSGYILHFPPIKDGCVAVDLSRGPESEAKKILDQNKVDVQAACGIMRDKGNGKVLLLRPFDANDVLFAAYFQASLFGNKGLKGHDDSDRGTMLMRHGIENLTEAPMLTSDSSRSIEAAMEKMKSEAEQRRAAGKSCNYMRIATANSAGGHAENIDVDALLKLDPSKLKKDKPYIIGDRNWGTRGFPMHLAMVKISDPGVKPPTYRFATVLPNGKRYNWADIKTIAIYATGVKQQGSRPWRMDEFGTIAYETGQTAST